MGIRTFKEALSYAIDREREASGQYDLFAARAKKPATRAMFRELAAEEKKHQAILEGVTRGQLAACGARRVRDPDPAAGAQVVKFDPDMDFVAALRLAIQREEEAVGLYQGLHEQADDAALCALFGSLVEQETGHRAKLKAELESVVLKDY